MRNHKQTKNWYDPDRFYRITKNYLIDPYEVIKQIEYYLEEYPYDYAAYTVYLRFLIDLKKYDEAEKIKDNIDNLLLLQHRFGNSKNEEATRMSDDSLFISKFRLLFNREDYEEAYKMLKGNKDIFARYSKSFSDILSTMHILEKKLELPISISPNLIDSYIFKQIREYSYDDFLYHIKDHINDDISENEEEKFEALFYENFPIEKVASEIRRIIPNNQGFYKTLNSDVYIFKYDDNGKSAYKNHPAAKNTNYFKVIAFHNTNNLITMYPCRASHCRYYIDLNYLKKEEEPIQRVSQIDKFNKKYTKVRKK